MADTEQLSRVFRVHFTDESTGIFLERKQKENKGELIRLKGRDVQVHSDVVPKREDPEAHMTFYSQMRERNIDQAVTFIQGNPPMADQDNSYWVKLNLERLKLRGCILK